MPAHMRMFIFLNHFTGVMENKSDQVCERDFNAQRYAVIVIYICAGLKSIATSKQKE